MAVIWYSVTSFMVKKRFPRYGVPIWSLWPNIRFLPSIVAEKNATKNGHIQNVCSMCIKINRVGKQEVGIWWVQQRFPWYGVPLWSLWPNIRFMPSIVVAKKAMKNILDGRKDGQTKGRTEVNQYTPLRWSGGIIKSKCREGPLWLWSYGFTREAFLDPSDSYFLFV
jgi:hypothetical protein